MTIERIYLVGFIAAGKSTVARALARRLGWRALDIDEMIETRERRSVAGIFAAHGEPHFRLAEREALRQTSRESHVVVATGSGTYVDLDNRNVINGRGVAVWLDVPWAVAADRAPSDGSRPLARDRAQFEALYQARRPAYQKSSLSIDATSPVEEIVERILDWLGY